MCVFLHTIRTCVQEIWCTNDIERPIRGQQSNQKARAWRAHAHRPYWAYHPYLAHQAHWAYRPYHPYLAHHAYCLIALIIPIWLIRPIGLIALIIPIWLIRPIGLIGPNKPDEPNRADRPLCGRRQTATQKASNNNAKGRLPRCGRRPFAKSLTVKLLAMLLLAAIARALDAVRTAARPPDDGRQASPTRPAQAGCQAYHSRRRG